MAMPGIFRHMMRSGWCFAISRFYDDDYAARKNFDNTALKFVFMWIFREIRTLEKEEERENFENLHS
jgi:hypothetical protein